MKSGRLQIEGLSFSQEFMNVVWVGSHTIQFGIWEGRGDDCKSVTDMAAARKRHMSYSLNS